MGQEKILIASSDKDLCCFMQKRMAPIGIEVYDVGQIAEAFAQYIQHEYHLVMLDIHMVDQTYLDQIFQMRQTKPMPILALSPSLSPEDKLSLFQSGVNALIERPFDLDVCAAQVYALIQLHMNSYTVQKQSAIVHGTELIINPRYRQILIDGKPLALTRKEFDLLYYFAEHPGQVFSCAQLYRQIWDEVITQGSNDTVKSHIKTLRKKLASAGKTYIQNVWGIGYKFVLT